MTMPSEVCIALGNQLDDYSYKFIGEVWRRRLMNTFEHKFYEFEVNLLNTLPSTIEVDEVAEWCDQTSTTSISQAAVRLPLTKAAEEDVEEYRPVSHYRSPDDWGQVTSSAIEPRILSGHWMASRATRIFLDLDHYPVPWCVVYPRVPSLVPYFSFWQKLGNLRSWSLRATYGLRMSASVGYAYDSQTYTAPVVHQLQTRTSACVRWPCRWVDAFKSPQAKCCEDWYSLVCYIQAVDFTVHQLPQAPLRVGILTSWRHPLQSETYRNSFRLRHVDEFAHQEDSVNMFRCAEAASFHSAKPEVEIAFLWCEFFVKIFSAYMLTRLAGTV